MTEYYSQPESVVFTTPEPSSDYLAYWRPDMSILDLGCGYGRTLAYLKQQGFTNLFGVDTSPTLIQRAKADQVTLPEKLYVSDILKFQPPEPMAVVLIMGVIEYFVSQASREALVAWLDSIVLSQGYVYLATFLRSPHYYPKYVRSKINGQRWGTIVTDTGMVLFHDNEHGVDKLFSSSFHPVRKEKKAFKTWSNQRVPGYISLYQHR